MEDIKPLIQKAQAGDLDAFEELVRTYQNRVFALALQLTANHADAQDLAQEAFIRAYRALKGFRNESDFGTWLHRITVNLWLNMRRRESKRTVVSLDEPITAEEGEFRREVAAGDGDPVEALEDKEFRELTRSALGELPQEQRAVLVLREVEGYSYEEVAKILNCSLGTVKSRLNRARQALKQIMAEKTRR